MCGICGVYSLSFGAGDLKLFKQLLYLNEIRGQDSTGIIRLNKNKTPVTTWYKDSIRSSDFLRHPDAQKAMTASDVYGYIGHTRAATIGKVSDENAHPFDFSKVIGVHNGTIRKAFKFDREHDTDSEAIYHCINDLGLKEGLEEFSAKDSAYTLNWVNKADKTLNWLSNGRRPIHFTYVYGRNTLMWSSMQEQLELVIAYNSLTATGWLEDHKDKGDRFFTLEPHDLLSLNIGTHPKDFTGTEHIDVDPDKAPPPRPVTVWSSDRGYSHGGMSSANWMGEESYESFWEDLDDDELDEKGRVKQTKTFRPTEWKEINGYWCKVFKGTREIVEQYPSGAQPPEKEDSSPFDDGAVPSFLLPGPPGVKGKSKVVDGEVVRPASPPKYHYEPPVTPSEISYRLSQGCFICNTKYKLEEYRLVQDDPKKEFKFRWWNREAFCCPDCASEEAVRRMYFGEGV